MKRLFKIILLTFVMGLIATSSFAFMVGDIDFMKVAKPGNAIADKMLYYGARALVVQNFGSETIKLVWVEIQQNSFDRRWVVIKVAYYKEKVLQVYHNVEGTGTFIQKYDIPAKEKAEIEKDLADAKLVKKFTGTIWHNEWGEGSLHKVTQ